MFLSTLTFDFNYLILIFKVYLYSWTSFIFFVSFNSDILFWLNFRVIFYFLGPYWAIFGVGEGFEYCIGVYSCSWTTFILYVFVNSDIWFLFNSRVNFTFWGPNELFLGLRQGLNTVLGSTHVVEQLSFCMFSSILIFDFYLILGSFLTFWGPNGLFLGLG